MSTSTRSLGERLRRLSDHLKKFVVRSDLFSFGWDCRVTLNHVGGAFVVRLDDVGANADVDVTSEFMLCMLEHYRETTLPRAELTYAAEDGVWACTRAMALCWECGPATTRWTDINQFIWER